MHKTLCLALLLAASAVHALTAEESQTLRQAAITAGKQGDDATAFAHWQTLAEAGDAEAQLTLGLLHYQGDGTAQDSTQARMAGKSCRPKQHHCPIHARRPLSARRRRRARPRQSARVV